MQTNITPHVSAEIKLKETKIIVKTNKLFILLENKLILI